MPFIASVSKIDLPFKTAQQEAKEQARLMFAENFPQVDRLIHAFDNTEIITRNFCEPMSYYKIPNTFEERNDEYIQMALAWSVKAIEDCIIRAGIDKQEITDILFVSTTGLATPSSQRTAAVDVSTAPIPAANRLGGPAVGRLGTLTRGRTSRMTNWAIGLPLGPNVVLRMKSTASTR